MKDPKSRFDGNNAEARVAALCFGITLFADVPASGYGAGLLDAFSLFREVAGPDAVKVYATDTMREHKPVTKRALALLDTWLAPGAPPRETIGVEYSDADPYHNAPRHRFWVSSEEDAEAAAIWPSMVRIDLDTDWATGRYEDAVSLVIEFAKMVPVRSGYAGFAFEYSRYFAEEGCEHAWRYSMRHPGIEIQSPHGDELFATLKDSVYTTNWLTLLDRQFVKKLGGRQKLRASLPSTVQIYEIDNGLLLRAGEKPAIGDVNRNDKLPDYRAVYEAVRPLTLRVPERLKYLDLEDNEEERTLRWYNRWNDE
jgi:hypothetical protein